MQAGPSGKLGPFLQGNTSDDEFSDDDDTDLTPLMGGNGGGAGNAEKTPGWDAFQNPPPPQDSLSVNSDKFMLVTIKVIKVLTYLLTFLIVLGCGVITKGLVLLMASQLKFNKTLSYCPNENSNTLGTTKTYVTSIPPLENVAWAWMLFFAYIVPELGTLFRSGRMCLFKGCVKKFWEDERSTASRFADLAIVALFESLHAVGTGLLIYAVLPDLDVIKGVMLTNCVAFIPGLFGMLSRDKDEPNIFWKVLADIFALICQATGFFVWPLIAMWEDDTVAWQVWLIPVAVILTSFGWWENYVDSKSNFRIMKHLGKIKDRMRKTRYFMYIFVSVLKCLIFFTVMVVAMGVRLDFDYDTFFDLSNAFGVHYINVTETRQLLPENSLPDLDLASVVPLMDATAFPMKHLTPLHVFLIQMSTAYASYVFGKFACKICIQGFSFAFPVNLTVPVSISLLITFCGLRAEDVCAFDFMPGYLFWESRNGTILIDFLKYDYAWVWLLWLLSQTWITLHIWLPKCERLATTEKLFVTPMYNSMVIDQSLALNRRRDDDPDVNSNEVSSMSEEQDDQYYEKISGPDQPANAVRKTDSITRIYACATMWHENGEEMMEFLKSIMRMDEDQSARKITMKYLKVVDKDYYSFETHIFFDDAFALDKTDGLNEYVVNQFVKLLVERIDEAASHVHQTIIRVRPPKRIPTPYGGRLVWTLPGKTRIIAHLKNKDKIRHKKRWSQVMYMYYLLGFKLMDQDISYERKEVIAENTLILALDGDIDFTPKAVGLLVDLMRKNNNLGAACGRIHPVGTGLMVWYQMFEYAIGHWLQKATEHMIGCVLCSPGCFSLFRGRALMDDSVMAKYTTVSEEARHYVQYDQGEDRWLCTLLLQRGYRVEYSAASDAYTHAPEGFGEFYNQRRRWVPSTMANIMDLLGDYKRTVKVNDNISMPYILYQVMLLFGTILGPGTIFLMLVGAFVAAFAGVGNWAAFQMNLYPIILFMLVCFAAKQSRQITLAYILTAFYALVMCMVAVALALNMAMEGTNTPSAIFLFATAASFVITALLHPQEFWCLPTGMLYYLLVPSMYLLLMIYSLFNLNDVSWGTRDVPVQKTKQEEEADRKAQEEAERKRKQGGILGMLSNSNGKNDDEGSIEFSFAGLFKVMCCVQPKQNESQHIVFALEDLKRKLDRMESHLGGTPNARRRSTLQPRTSIRSGDTALSGEVDDDQDSFEDDNVSKDLGVKEERDDLVNPYWMEDVKAIRRGEIDYLPVKEVNFFKDLIEKYLKPLESNKETKAKAQRQLKELRNIAVFSFTMMNSIFVVIVFFLQLNKDTIHINWPLGIKTNITFVAENTQVLIAKEYLELEPIGLVFVFFFAIILVVQFVAMLLHRFGTFSHILASTELTFCSSSNGKMDSGPNDAQKALEVVKQLQKLKNINGEYGEGNGVEDKAGRRRTIANIAMNQNKQNIGTLDVAFRKRFLSIAPEGARDVEARRNTIRALANTNMQTMGANRRASLARKTSFAAGPTIIE